MPFKLKQDHRHIPRQKHKVTNSAACDAALRQRGSLTVWFTQVTGAVASFTGDGGYDQDRVTTGVGC